MKMLFESAPMLKLSLEKTRIENLIENDFVEICKLIHAFRAVARQVSNKALNLPEGSETDIQNRIELLAKKDLFIFKRGELFNKR